MEQTPDDESGVCGTTDLQISDGIAGRILPKHPTEKQDWLRLVRALRSEHNWNLVYKHRANLSAHLNNVVQFPGAP